MRLTRSLSALLTCACLPVACLPTAALATPSVSLRASFSPKILGRPTTVDLRIRIAPSSTELLPPPLTEANVRFPAGLDIALSGLGIDTCSAATLTRAGLPGCSANSLMGRGHAIAEFTVKHEVFRESARIAIVRTTEHEDHMAMLLYLYNETAVSARIILPSELLPAARPFEGRLNIKVPLVQTLPEAPDLAVAEIELVLGPKDLTYYEHAHGKIVAYKPAGIDLPEHCPRGGFPFTADLTFLGAGHAASSTAVRCPARARHG